jgi:DNA invertase Pin-like site-specific DNA recombinase
MLTLTKAPTGGSILALNLPLKGSLLGAQCQRLGRTAKGLLTLLDELQTLGVGFVSLREGFDLGTPAGRLMAGVLASVAAYETEVRNERQLAGIARAKADGKTWGGRKAGTRVRLTEEKEAVIRQLYGEGKAVASIARLVGLTRKTVYRALGRSGAKP